MHAGGRPARRNRRPCTAAGQAVPAGASGEGLSRTTRDKAHVAPPAGGGYGGHDLDMWCHLPRLISSLAEGRTETPQTRQMLAPTGPASGRIAMGKGHHMSKPWRTQTRSKKPRRRFWGVTFGRVAGRRASFSGGCCISDNSRTPTGLTNDDVTTTTRNAKHASYAPARPVPRVRRVCDGHGGAVVLVVGRVAFVSCATPRGTGTNLNGSDAAAWWFVCRYW